MKPAGVRIWLYGEVRWASHIVGSGRRIRSCILVILLPFLRLFPESLRGDQVLILWLRRPVLRKGGPCGGLCCHSGRLQI